MLDEPRVPPQNLDAEQSVLGAMLISEEAVTAVSEILTADHFYRQSNGIIFAAALWVVEQGDPLDAITLADALDHRGELAKAGGRERINQLSTLTPSTQNVAHYALIVREAASLRGLIRAGTEIANLGWERPGQLPELLETAQASVFDLAMERHTSDFVPISDPLREAFRRMQSAADSEPVGLLTGFERLDELTTGFQPGNLIVIAARPSMGKTALGLNLISNVALKLGLRAALFTLEMSQHEVTQRILSAEASVPSQKMRTGKLSTEQWADLTAAGARLHDARLMIDDSSAVTAVEMRAKARRLKLRYPDLALIVVDYLQLMTSGGDRWENRQQDVSQTSRSLKVLAGDLQVPVVALSQLSRSVETRHDKRPILSDLRESGAIEQDADVVMFLYRDEYYHPEDTDQQGVAEVNVAKQRNGPTGTIKLSFLKRYARFGNLALPERS